MALELSSTTKAKIAAAALTALSAMSGSFTASAQQMAAAPSTPDFSTCDRMSEANPKGAIACRVEVLNRQTAALRQWTQVAQIDGDCAREISELRATNPAATEIARELVRVSCQATWEIAPTATRGIAPCVERGEEQWTTKRAANESAQPLIR